MAVDFSLLPVEEPHDGKPPSRFVWTVVFLAMTLVGIFAVLFFWPKSLPTHTSKFWITLVLFPVGVPSLIILRRFAIFEGRKLDVALRNEVVRAFNERVFQAASIPLTLIGSAYRFSAKAEENTVESIRSGALVLESKAPIGRTDEVVKARWLVTPGMPVSPGGVEADRKRQRHVTQWLFDELLDELADRVRSVPARIPLNVRLAVSNALTPDENRSLWLDAWHARSFRQADIAKPSATPPDLMMLDSWLDETLVNTGLHAELLIVIHLQPLFAKTPYEQANTAKTITAEAGVALLLLPEALTRRHKVQAAARLHRPVRAPLEQPADALSHAAKWADVQISDIARGWQSHLAAEKADSWCEAAKHHGLSATLMNLDQTVGHAGFAAPWLAIACAAASLAPDTATQLVLAGQEAHLDCAVLKHPCPSPASHASQRKASASEDAGRRSLLTGPPPENV